MNTPVIARYQFGPWTLKVHQNLLGCHTTQLTLEHRHTCLLVYFLEHPNQTLSKDQLLHALWEGKVVNEDSLTVAISQLRKALNDNARAPEFIKTIPGVGYQFIFSPITAIPHPNPSDGVIPPAVESPPLATETPSASLSVSAKAVRYPLVRPVWLFTVGVLLSLGIAAFLLSPHYNPTPEEPPLTQAARLLQSENERDIRQAIQAYKAAIKQNPENAYAYLGVAEGKMKLLGQDAAQENAYKEILGYLNKALEISPNLPRAHLWAAYLIAWREMDYINADAHYKAALALSPKDETVLAHYAHFLMVQQRFEEAQTHIQKQRNLNPLNYSNVHLAWVYLLEKQFHLAEQELKRIARTETTDRYYHEIAQNVYFHLGNEQATYQELRWFFEPAKFSSQKIQLLDDLFAQKGIKAVYAWLLETKETAELGQFTPPIAWARYAFASNQKQLGMQYLEQAIKERNPHAACVAVDPLYRTLLDEAHLTELLKKT